MAIFTRYSWWLGAMGGLAALLALMGQAGVLGPVQGLYLTVTRPLDRVITGLTRPVAGVLSDIGDLQDIRDENRALRIEVETLRNQVIELDLARERIEQLESALEIAQTRPAEQREFANVIKREVTPFTEVIHIDKGESSGIRKGMVVLSAQGTLVGSVVEVFRDVSIVQTISDSRSRVIARVVETGVEGTVAGTANRRLNFTLTVGAVNVGERVITSPLSGRFPPDIPIGVISEVSGAPHDINPTVRIEPFVRISDVTAVVVITSFVPSQAPVAAP